VQAAHHGRELLAADAVTRLDLVQEREVEAAGVDRRDDAVGEGKAVLEALGDYLSMIRK
jgi:hypothetical protein